MPRTIFLACLLLLAPALPAAAQNTQANVVTPAPPPREGTVGPEQLRDFSLPGTRRPDTQPATETPAPATTAPPSTRTPAPAPRPAPATTDAAPTRRSESVALPPAARTEPTPVVAPPQQQVTVGLPEPVAAPTPAPVSDLATPSLPVGDVAPPPADDVPASVPESGAAWWPWALAAVAAGIALALWLRRRGRERDLEDADDGLVLAPVGLPRERSPTPVPPAPAPTPAPAPAPAPAPPLPTGMVTSRLRTAPPPPPEAQPSPTPAPQAAPLPAGGIVSTRLRPWIDLDLAVSEILLDETQVIIRIAIVLANGGTAAARDVIVEALPLNAGDNQAAELAAYFERAASTDSGLAELPRGAATELTHEIRINRASIREYEAQGRRLFVPIIAFNVSYRWGGGTGRTGSAFLVGHQKPGSDRLAPLVLQPGEARLAGLGAKRLDEAVRR
ncbi:hypothetical protein GCM10022280_24840 [Sphingomonas swuensis]|uniref:Uncharacterized protein n=1 Tax=Sphingomonas swuensis TaxID=977800 RepID=A0ABP7TAE3_9SPHN